MPSAPPSPGHCTHGPAGILGSVTTHRNNWRHTVWLFAATGFVESLAFGHLGAFMPILLDELGVPRSAAPAWIGVLSSLAFVIGLPLLPFWGVWAERYGRKLIIIRSSVAGALMFALAGLSRDVWMLASARLLGGFVLGNTGVMMAVQESITPADRLGRAVALISAGAPVGMAIGPFLGGQIVAAYSVRSLLLMDAALTLVMALILVWLLKEEPRSQDRHIPTGTGVVMALRAITGNRRVGTLFGAAFIVALGASAAQPYVPVVLQQIHKGPGLAETIGFVFTVSGIVMAASTPVFGAIGDRAGHLAAWRAAAIIAAVGVAGLAYSGTDTQVVVWRSVQVAAMGGMGALTMVLLARHSDAATRTPVLTLSLLPNQLSWFLGPLLGSFLATRSLQLPFLFGAVACGLGAIMSLSLSGPRAARRTPNGT